MAVADTKVPLFKDHFWHFQIKIKFWKKTWGRAASDYRTLISSGLFPAQFYPSIKVILKHKHLTWINFLLIKYKLINFDWIFDVTWINLLLVKHKVINFDWIINNWIFHNLLINYPSLIKKSQYRSSFSLVFFRIAFLKNS